MVKELFSIAATLDQCMKISESGHTACSQSTDLRQRRGRHTKALAYQSHYMIICVVPEHPEQSSANLTLDEQSSRKCGESL